MGRKTGKNGKGFGKPEPNIKPDLEGARQAGVMIAMSLGMDVELRKCNSCTDYYHVVPKKDKESCETCGKTDYELISTFKPGIG